MYSDVFVGRKVISTSYSSVILNVLGLLELLNLSFLICKIKTKNIYLIDK